MNRLVKNMWIQQEMIRIPFVRVRFRGSSQNLMGSPPAHRGPETWHISVSMIRCVVLLVSAGTFITGCSSRKSSFSSAKEAAQALVVAMRADNSEEVKSILGREAEDIVSSGDEVADRQAREKFLKAYDEKNAMVTEPDGSVTLQVGQNDWPMPIPIVERRGSWRFDTKRGRDEILNRRIGRNELSAMEVCRAIVDAQREYVATDPDRDGVREYARKIVSDPGKKNGLYWPTGEGESSSPMGPLVAEAEVEGYGKTRTEEGKSRPYQGYHYRLLTSQGDHAPGGSIDFLTHGRLTGGFALVAWPASYRNSGVMTFLMNQNGIMFERDLGRRTDRIAESISAYDPGRQWRLVESTP